MSTIVMRNFAKESAFQLSPEAQQRAYDYLVSVGYSPKDLEPIEWPDDAVSAYRRYPGDTWKFTLKSDILKSKIELMNQRLWLKREQGLIRLVPLYVWVFWCPGVGGFAFRGWWTYLIGRDIEYGGRYQYGTDLIKQSMSMFPVVDKTPALFEVEHDWKVRERWMIEFAKRYQRGKRCGKPQGKAPVWAEVKDSRIIKLLGHGQWHSGRVAG